MKILLASYFPFPHVGGVNRYIDTLKKELEENGHHVDILAHHQDMRTIYKYSHIRDEFGRSLTGREIDKTTNSHEKRLTIKDVIDHQMFQYFERHLPGTDPAIRWREVERYTFEVSAALLDLQNYDVIHTQDILSTRALSRAKPHHIPLVATIHGILATEYIHSGAIASKESLKWKYAAAEEYVGHMSSDATIVPTRWQKKILGGEYGVHPDKLTVLPYALDLPPFLTRFDFEPYPPLTANQQAGGRLIIACPARLVPEKDHKTLIEALRIVKERESNFVCWLIGDGKLRDELEMQAKKSGVWDHLVFFGDRYDVEALLKLSDIVALASIQDMHPYTLMEAQVAGKPCVASDAGGIPEVVCHEETGLIFQTGNSVQLAESLIRLLTNQELRFTLGMNAAGRARIRFSSKTMFEKTIGIYVQAIERKKHGSEERREQPDLSGKHGLVSKRIDRSGKAESIFSFDIDPAKFDAAQWSNVLKRVPPDYSIPDPAFIKTLTE
ncbi:glycosyltransferase family 4 protein [Brevibacillus sp. FSL K6-6036]|uniref:glycosyltransferase family 4 protein n=1 Tax=Brevibacillus TaxID=55080 RepID=UPI0030D3E9C5